MGLPSAGEGLPHPALPTPNVPTSTQTPVPPRTTGAFPQLPFLQVTALKAWLIY